MFFMTKRVEIDPIITNILEEMKSNYKINSNKELVEKCILFCYHHKVNFEKKGTKSINEIYILIEKLNKSIEELPMNIVKVIETEG